MSKSMFSVILTVTLVCMTNSVSCTRKNPVSELLVNSGDLADKFVSSFSTDSLRGRRDSYRDKLLTIVSDEAEKNYALIADALNREKKRKPGSQNYENEGGYGNKGGGYAPEGGIKTEGGYGGGSAGPGYGTGGGGGGYGSSGGGYGSSGGDYGMSGYPEPSPGYGDAGYDDPMVGHGKPVGGKGHGHGIGQGKPNKGGGYGGGDSDEDFGTGYGDSSAGAPVNTGGYGPANAGNGKYVDAADKIVGSLARGFTS